MYKLCPAVRKFYQLRAKSSASHVSIASRVVDPKHDELLPAVIKEVYQLYRKVWVYNMSNSWKVLTQFSFTPNFAASDTVCLIHPYRTLDVYWPVRKMQVAHSKSMNFKQLV